MTSRPRRGTISVALVGIGELWENRVKPAIQEFRDRVKIAGVFDEVRSRSLAVASEFKADCLPSITALSERPDIDGVIICDAGWMKSSIIELLTMRRKDCLIFDWERLSEAELQRIAELADDVGTTLMVDFEARFQPVLRRLRELSATELGPARHIEIFLPALSSHLEARHQYLAERELIEWLDASQVLFGRTPHALVARPETSILRKSPSAESQLFSEAISSQKALWWPWWGREGSHLSAMFRPAAPSSKRVRDAVEDAGKTTSPLSLTFQREIVTPTGELSCDEKRRPEIRARLTFANGSSQFSSTTELTWTPQDGVVNCEDLSGERPAHVLMLDQFIRRSIGGLLPVPELSQILRFRQLLRNLSWEPQELPNH
ncbi:Oxidoreductase family, NAD-binding Rossmann fold [Planctopirus ephydatiae]|uniref:Oxidoreductase family, NAD-binding Rossmann fold n=1 Tax=Planctopirus ephydatiae TaxID=2528019 RepID=A0A518GRF7_9PLAN|nr:Gfo/Idh/MocA family oxidoreductase [Planctopirus ephydatiae]QDV31183.1 Oxidoreductase family, NAD-binding Rossmann fold [Planctopirus ephydatiae]